MDFTFKEKEKVTDEIGKNPILLLQFRLKVKSGALERAKNQKEQHEKIMGGLAYDKWIERLEESIAKLNHELEGLRIEEESNRNKPDKVLQIPTELQQSP